MANNKYCDYFNVKEEYFSCIDQSAINAGIDWQSTYPHQTFIDLLNATEKMLGGSTKQALWIHGAYGTGKSQCAYALKEILEVPEEEVRAYWEKYEALKANKALLEKLIGHKKHGIVTAFRYASGSITSPQQFFYAVQESVKEALDKIPNSYKGENTLKEGIIAWLEEPAQKNFVNELLQKPEWMAEFSQSTSDEIIYTLKNSTDVTDLMESIFKMADKEGIRALSLTSDTLCKWIIDVVSGNNMKFVLIWDEFSDFFKQNRNSLGEFQKIVSLCQETHFYFVIVTHPITSIAGPSISKDDPMSVVLQRFTRIEISLPANIAFELIGDAFKVIPAAQNQWDSLTEGLSEKINNSKIAVMKEMKVENESVMNKMLPIHPMTALVLENIASSFQSNQRSMFNFIKTPKDIDVHAFQWFIQETGPSSKRPFLTIDMLWDFFYENGKEYLSSSIKLILDVFPQREAELSEEEKVVLKTVLIMQAVDQKLAGSIPLLAPTYQNLKYAFEGDYEDYANKYKSIVDALVEKNILTPIPIGNNETKFSVAVRIEDTANVENLKIDLRKKTDISKLVEQGNELGTALELTRPLRLRYIGDVDEKALPIVDIHSFPKIMDEIKGKDEPWRFYAVLAVAKTEEEALSFRKIIKEKIENKEYENILVIDALSNPLGLEAFEKFVDNSAMSLYYTGKEQAKTYTNRASEILNDDWRNKINEGPFIIWSYTRQEGENCITADAVRKFMQATVFQKFDYCPDFNEKLSESLLKYTKGKALARYGMGDVSKKELITGYEELVLGTVWNHDNYWNEPEFKNEKISNIKKEIVALIDETFNESGYISIEEIYLFLEQEYGFTPSNLTAFIVGFLLKEYNSEPYRFQDSEGHRESMTPDKLAEMIGNCIGGKAKPTYIVNLTPDEKAFYELTEYAWGLSPDSCASPTRTGARVQGKMKELLYPVWTLAEVDDKGVYDIVQKYIKLVQDEPEAAYDTALEIGRIANQNPDCANDLKELLTSDNCKEGMLLFLKKFEEGRLLSLSEEIGAADHLLSDIRDIFNVKYSALWQTQTGEDEIRKIIEEYEFIKKTNELLEVSNSTLKGAYKSWRQTLKVIGFSCEAIQTKYPSLNKLFGLLREIATNKDLIQDQISQLLEEFDKFDAEIRDILRDPVGVFSQIYDKYLQEFEPVECEKIKNSITEDLFLSREIQSNTIVQKAAETYKNNQLKTQLFEMWSAKTGGTKTPKQWSENYKTPILCCVDEKIYDQAKKAFEILNSNIQNESDINWALNFLNNATFFDEISQAEYRDECFAKRIIGYYKKLLPNIQDVRSELEKLPVDPYDWNDNPSVRNKIKNMAEEEYQESGKEKALNKIDSIEDTDKLREWLKELVNKDMDLGIKIIDDGGQD